MLQTCCDVQFILFLSVTLHPSKQHKHICAHACTHARTHALVTGTDGNSNVVTITPTPITNTLWAIVAFNFHFDCGIVSAFEQENASLAACGSIAVHDKKGASGAVLTPVGQHPVHFKIATTTNEGVVGASTATAEDRSSLPPGLVLPPNAMAIPLASGSPIAITAVASGGASLELDPSKAAKVIASRKKELVAGLDAEYPRKNPTTVPGGELRDSIEAMYGQDFTLKNM